MKVRVIRSFTDKYTMSSVPKGTELDISEERHAELTSGPRGVFVIAIETEPLMSETKEKTTISEDDCATKAEKSDIVQEPIKTESVASEAETKAIVNQDNSATVAEKADAAQEAVKTEPTASEAEVKVLANEEISEINAEKIAAAQEGTENKPATKRKTSKTKEE